MKIHPGRKMNRKRILNHPHSRTLTLHSHSLFLLHGSLPLFGSSLAPENCRSLLPSTYCLPQWMWAGQRSVPGQTEGQPGEQRVTRAWICPHRDWWPGSLSKFQEFRFVVNKSIVQSYQIRMSFKNSNI